MTTLSSLPSEFNESTDANGNWVDAWTPVLTSLGQLEAAQVTSSQHELQRRYRENGLAFRAALRRRQAGQRPWHLDLMPQIMATADWKTLESGLQQRARLKAALLKDLYGEQQVLREGVVPAQAVFAHHGFIESAVGVPVFDTMPLYTADVSRSPSGAWYVADDICQAPNGIGYTIENRLILSGVLSNLYRQSRIRRVAGYFKNLRRALFQTSDHDARCVILGYGASHHYDFEQAYLAKYLGYTLVQINDLTVRGKHVWLKTVDGLQRVDVIFRFVDDADLDPLAGKGSNTSGVPGLLHAARVGGVTVVNPIGSAAIENPAFNAWLPELCEFLLNEKIELLGSPTYWMGDDDHRQQVENRFESLLYRNIDTRSELQDPALLSASELHALRTQIAAQPERYIAQERIGRSLTPSLTHDHIEQRQLTMRMYLMAEGNTYQAMPGGLGLLDSQSGGGRPNIREMEYSKDVWVVSDHTVPYDTLLETNTTAAAFRLVEGELPSSVAESLFWLGRYAERIETSTRLLLGVCLHLRSDERFEDEQSAAASLASLLKSTTAVTGTLPGFSGAGGRRKIAAPDRELISLLTDADKPGALPNTLESLSYSAAMVRDRLSGDLFRVVNSLEDHLDKLRSLPQDKLSQDKITLTNTIDELNALLFSLAAFSGLTRENMTQGDGWRFLQIGKRIERTTQTSTLLSTVFSQYHNNNYALEDLLSVLCSSMTYRSRYRTLIDPSLVLNLLLVDESNPRSLGYQLKDMESHIQLLPGKRKADFQDPALRSVAEGLARIRLVNPARLFQHDKDNMHKLKRFFVAINKVPSNISNAISAEYFTHTDLPDILYSGFDINEQPADKRPPA